MATRVLLQMTQAYQQGQEMSASTVFCEAFGKTLRDESADPALLSLALTLPTETYLAEQVTVVDPQAIHAARQGLRLLLAKQWKSELIRVYHRNTDAEAYT